MRCHLWNFGDNKFQGDYRSSGCTGCHMPYRDDGRSQSDDPMIDKESPPHPEKHRLTNAIPTDQCLHCHYRGARIGPSFKGYRPGAGAGLNPEHADFLGEALHGHDASFYITDEDNRNSVDETPADVHFRAGMDCVDCHTSHDVHGDGHLYNDTNMATEVRCETCHGSADEESDLMTRLGNPMKNLHRDAQGDVWLTTKVKKKRLKVTQISRVIAGAGHDSFLHKSMGRDEDGFSHMDRLSCDACHSGWLPTCYGCHVNVDMRRVQRSLITGVSTPGQISGSRRWVSTDDLILLLSTDGKITPSMPTERMFFTAVDGDGTTVIDKQVRTGPMRNGERLEPNGNGHRAYHPHTVQRWSPFMRCERCHTVPGDAENAERFDQVVGFGTDRYIEVDGNGAGWRLDQVQTRDGEPTVLIGHEGEYKSRPLNLEEIERMRAVEIEVEDCSIPEGVTAPFGIVRDDVFATSCNGSGCHGETDQAADLYLGGNNLHARLTQTESQQTSKPLVVPGSLEDSYLWAKVQDADDIIGGRMPPGQPLTACQLRICRHGFFREHPPKTAGHEPETSRACLLQPLYRLSRSAPPGHRVPYDDVLHGLFRYRPTNTGNVSMRFCLLITLLVTACPAAETNPTADAGMTLRGSGPTDPPVPVEKVRPMPRSELLGAFDEQRRQLVFFGGDDGLPIDCQTAPHPVGLDDLWIYDAASATFEEIFVEGAKPPARARGMAVYDPTGDQMVIFGGRFRRRDRGEYVNFKDVWALDLENKTWRQIETGSGGPTARSTGGFDRQRGDDRLRWKYQS